MTETAHLFDDAPSRCDACSTVLGGPRDRGGLCSECADTLETQDRDALDPSTAASMAAVEAWLAETVPPMQRRTTRGGYEGRWWTFSAYVHETRRAVRTVTGRGRSFGEAIVQCAMRLPMLTGEMPGEVE